MKKLCSLLRLFDLKWAVLPGVRLQCNTTFEVLQFFYRYYFHRTGNLKFLTQIAFDLSFPLEENLSYRDTCMPV